MTYVMINPGTGPVPNATEEQARRNMQDFVAELDLGDAVSFEMAGPSKDASGNPDGRWTFVVRHHAATCEVEMPGVAGLAEAARTAKIHPRLYVDGSSWFWDFALNMTAFALMKGDGDVG